MKQKDFSKGLLVRSKNSKLFGELVSVSTRGTVVIKSYYDNCNHYINLRKLVPLEILIEPDGAEFHIWTPALKGCHTCGETKEEAFNNIKDAIKAYIESMRDHGELKSWDGHTKVY